MMTEENTFMPLHESGADDAGQIHVLGDAKKQIHPVFEEASAVSRSEILDFGNQCFLLHNMMSETECRHIIEEGDKAGFEHVFGARDDYRSQQRISVECPELSERLWERLQPWLCDISIGDDPREQHVHGIKFLLKGVWRPAGLNTVWRLGRYEPGGHFAPHFDGFFARSSTERSLQTFMCYLNQDFEGGCTNFVDEKQNLYKDENGKYCAEEENILCGIKPESGMAIVFNHQRLHEGQKLGSGVKYILRTDIMYRNTNRQDVSEAEEKALQLVQEAERKEAAGSCLEAAELYRRAFKLSAAVEAAYSG